MKNDLPYILHILEAIDEIEKHSGNDERDLKTQRAIERCLQIIGEAARKLSNEFTLKHDGIPWRDIVGLRNKIVHDYFGIDEQVLWDVVEHELPVLKPQIEALLRAIT